MPCAIAGADKPPAAAPATGAPSNTERRRILITSPSAKPALSCKLPSRVCWAIHSRTLYIVTFESKFAGGRDAAPLGFSRHQRVLGAGRRRRDLRVFRGRAIAHPDRSPDRPDSRFARSV